MIYKATRWRCVAPCCNWNTALVIPQKSDSFDQIASLPSASMGGMVLWHEQRTDAGALCCCLISSMRTWQAASLSKNSVLPDVVGASGESDSKVSKARLFMIQSNKEI
jgi:hypothetical protein